MIKVLSISLISLLALVSCQVGRGGTISTPSAPLPGPTSSPLPTANPSSVPVPTSSPIPSPSATAGQVHEQTHFFGSVFSDTGQPLAGVTITTQSLNPAVFFEDTTTTDESGAYLFIDGPRGIDILLMASKEGYQTQEQTIVIKTAPLGDSTTNRFDFGAADPSMPAATPGLSPEVED